MLEHAFGETLQLSTPRVPLRARRRKRLAGPKADGQRQDSAEDKGGKEDVAHFLSGYLHRLGAGEENRDRTTRPTALVYPE